MTTFLYEDSPKYDLWLKIVLALPLILYIVLGLLIHYGVLPAEPEEEARMGLVVLFASTIFVLLLYWAILPRKYQILEDRIKIVLGKPFSFNIGFNTIQEARMGGGEKALAYWGIRFAPSIKNIVEIIRSKGMNVVISPSNDELFLQELNRAIANWKRSHGYREADKMTG